MAGFLKRRKRQKLIALPLTGEQRQVLETVPYYQRLKTAEKQRLEGLVQVLLHEKNFEGCRGLEVTDRMRIFIAAHASLLLLGRDFDFYSRLSSILIYPESFFVHSRGRVPLDDDDFDDGDVRTGESWGIGALILSWKDVVRDSRLHSNRHVIIHEFAHQLDQADGLADGWPNDLDPQMEPAWAAIMNNEFERLQEATDAGVATLIDDYGATKPSEFFAVVSELFFLQPHALHLQHPDLYALLQGFYAQDPRERFAVTEEA